MTSKYKDGDTVLIKAYVDWGRAKPGRMVRCIANGEEDTPLWILPEDIVAYPPSTCDGNRGDRHGDKA
jgi:hypothetical protein